MILPIKILNDLIGSTLHRLNISLVVDNGNGTYTLDVDNTFYLTINRVIDINGNSYTVKGFVLNESITISGTILPTVSFFDIDPPTFVHGTPQAVNGEHDAKITEGTNYPFIWLLEFMESNYDDTDESSITATLDLNLFFLTDVNFEDFDIDKSQSYAIDPMSNEIDFFIRTLKARRDLFGKFDNHTITNHINFGTYIVDKGYKTQIITDHLSGCQLKLNLPYVIDICQGGAQPISICFPVSIYEDGIFKESIPSGGRFDYTSGAGADATEIIEDTDGNTLYIDTIPSGGTNTREIQDATNTLNGNAISGILAEGFKTIVIQNDATTPIQVGTIRTDTKTSLIVEVPAGGAGVLPYGYARPVNSQMVTYVDHDDKYNKDNNVDLYIFNPLTHQLPILDPDDWWVMLTPNKFGSFHRFTSRTGGYYDHSTSQFKTLLGVVTTFFDEFKDGDAVVAHGYIFDNYTGIGHLSGTQGSASWDDFVNTFVPGYNSIGTNRYFGFTDWKMPSLKEDASIRNPSFDGVGVSQAFTFNDSPYFNLVGELLTTTIFQTNGPSIYTVLSSVIATSARLRTFARQGRLIRYELP